MMILVNSNTLGEQIKLSAEAKMMNRESKRQLDRELEKAFGWVENLLNHLKKNKRLYLKLVVMLAMLFINVNPWIALPKNIGNVLTMSMNIDEAIAKINKIGTQFLKLANVIAYWVVLLLTGKRCIETAMIGDQKKVINVALQGIVIMGIIYFLPEIFNMMQGLIELD